jgi:hypothetical protein
MQTMRDPMLLPCGHIADRTSILAVGYCGFDRVPFRVDELIPVNPAITVLLKGSFASNEFFHFLDQLRRSGTTVE